MKKVLIIVSVVVIALAGIGVGAYFLTREKSPEQQVVGTWYDGENDVTIENVSDTCSIFNTVCIDKVEADLNREQIDLVVKVRRFTEAIEKKSESFIIKGEDQGDYDLSMAPSIIVYVCKEGDNLWDIAKKYNTTEEEIAEVNEIKLDEPIKAGKCLILQKKVSNID